MRTALLILLATLVTSTPAFSAGESDDAEVKAIASFILDVEAYKGMFYSVQDFCAPMTNKIIAEQSKRQWNENNKELLAAQESAKNKYFNIMRAKGVEAQAKARLNEVKRNTFTRAHDHNRLYKDILPLEDKHTACSKRLGEMNSDSMSFKKIAPNSYKYWRSNIAP